MVKLFEIYQNEEKFVYLNEVRVLSEEAVTVREADCAASFVINNLNTKRYATEHVFALCLSAATEILAVIHISTGGVTYACVPVDKVFQAALLTNAASLIMVHTHPSGRCVPSAEDLNATDNLVKAGKLIGMSVIDHLIVDDDEFYSIIAGRGGNL